MFIIVANWKANLSFHQTRSFCEENLQAFAELGDTKGVEIIVCPSFEALYCVSESLQDTAIQIGAQNCSAYTPGPYTGQVCAESLAEVGCTYTLIGHYESRTYLQELDIEIANKAERLLAVGIEPIVCIGETEREHETEKTLWALDRQLSPLFEKIEKNNKADQINICIAYEPVWAIGTGKTPNKAHLDQIFTWMHQQCATKIPNVTVRLMYGGSVTPETFCSLQLVSYLGGFLIGSASLDFKKFQNIVSSYR